MATPARKHHEITVTHNTFEEFTNQLNDAGVKLEKDDEILIKLADISIKGPILYRQVNLRHQVMQEVVKIYKTPMDKEEFEVSDSSHFIKFLDDVYNYILTGEKSERTTEAKVKTTNNAWK